MKATGTGAVIKNLKPHHIYKKCSTFIPVLTMATTTTNLYKFVSSMLCTFKTKYGITTFPYPSILSLVLSASVSNGPRKHVLKLNHIAMLVHVSISCGFAGLKHTRPLSLAQTLVSACIFAAHLRWLEQPACHASMFGSHT